MLITKSFGHETSELLITHVDGSKIQMKIQELSDSYPKLKTLLHENRIMLTVHGDAVVLIRLDENKKIHSFFKKTTKNTIAYLNSISPEWDSELAIQDIKIIKNYFGQ